MYKNPSSHMDMYTYVFMVYMIAYASAVTDCFLVVESKIQLNKRTKLWKYNWNIE